MWTDHRVDSVALCKCSSLQQSYKFIHRNTQELHAQWVTAKNKTLDVKPVERELRCHACCTTTNCTIVQDRNKVLHLSTGLGQVRAPTDERLILRDGNQQQMEIPYTVPPSLCVQY